MTISSQDINRIVDALQQSDWDEAVVVIGDVRIAVARNGARLASADFSQAPPVTAAPVNVTPAAAPVQSAPAVSPAPATAVAQPEVSPAATSGDGTGVPVTAPSVGTFWRAPEPSAPPFVQVGDHVEAGDTVGIVEIMKLMNNVAAGVSGVVTSIGVENGGAVQFGDILVTIRPDAE